VDVVLVHPLDQSLGPIELTETDRMTIDHKAFNLSIPGHALEGSKVALFHWNEVSVDVEEDCVHEFPH
jgi:hypothetical protein